MIERLEQNIHLDHLYLQLKVKKLFRENQFMKINGSIYMEMHKTRVSSIKKILALMKNSFKKSHMNILSSLRSVHMKVSTNQEHSTHQVFLQERIIEFYSIRK
jgi:virulence-associated protein VapD